MRVTPEDLEMLTRKKSPPATAKTRKAATTPKERDIQRAILEFLKTVPGVVAWKTGGGMFRLSYKGKERMVRMGRAGISDIVGWLQFHPFVMGVGELPSVAKFLAIEVKKPGRYLTEEQDAFMASVHRAGGLAIVAHSVDEVARGLGLDARTTGVGGVEFRCDRWR